MDAKSNIPSLECKAFLVAYKKHIKTPEDAKEVFSYILSLCDSDTTMEIAEFAEERRRNALDDEIKYRLFEKTEDETLRKMIAITTFSHIFGSSKNLTELKVVYQEHVIKFLLYSPVVEISTNGTYWYMHTDSFDLKGRISFMDAIFTPASSNSVPDEIINYITFLWKDVSESVLNNPSQGLNYEALENLDADYEEGSFDE